MSLSDRIRPNSEAAPWVIEEVKNLEIELKRLRRIIDSRPAINAGLPDTYIDWSRNIYVMDLMQAMGPDD